jgi:peptide deformylase
MRVQIVHWPSPVLLEGTKPLAREDLDADFRDTVENMARLMYDLRGVGLAAPQVGIAKRFMLVCPTGDLGDEEVAINPEILAQEGEEEMEEGCLSFPRVYGTILRPAKVKVRYRDLDWKERLVDLDGYVARIFQHELDHLNGIVFTTRMTQADLVRNKARLDEMKKAFVAFRA